MKAFLGMLCVLCGLAVAGAAVAQTAGAPTWVFTTIDAVRRSYETQLLLTGVQEGASGPSEVTIESYCPATGLCFVESLNSCERYALLMMSKPGQYKLEAWRRSSLGAPGYCRLSKLNP